MSILPLAVGTRFLEFVNDGLPCFALGSEGKEEDVLFCSPDVAMFGSRVRFTWTMSLGLAELLRRRPSRI